MCESLEKLLPHRKPMIVLSGVECVDVNKGTLTARADIKETDILFDPSVGGVPTYAAVEYMAQAVGCFVGYNDIKKNKTPGVGFVLGTRKLDVFSPILKSGERYLIDIRLLFFDENVASFECVMYNAYKENVAEAILNAYRPDHIETFMKEYAK